MIKNHIKPFPSETIRPFRLSLVKIIFYHLFTIHTGILKTSSPFKMTDRNLNSKLIIMSIYMYSVHCLVFTRRQEALCFTNIYVYIYIYQAWIQDLKLRGAVKKIVWSGARHHFFFFKFCISCEKKSRFIPKNPIFFQFRGRVRSPHPGSAPVY